MTNRTKIIMVMLIVLITAFGVYSKIKSIDEKTKPTVSEKENILNEYFKDVVENKQEDNKNNVIENVEETNQTENQIENETNKFVGKEEQGSNVVQKTDEEKAIDLAKKDWGSTASYYTFEAIKESTNKNKYIVKVRDKKTTQEVTRYYVDIELGTVTE